MREALRDHRISHAKRNGPVHGLTFRRWREFETQHPAQRNKRVRAVVVLVQQQ